MSKTLKGPAQLERQILAYRSHIELLFSKQPAGVYCSVR